MCVCVCAYLRVLWGLPKWASLQAACLPVRRLLACFPGHHTHTVLCHRLCDIVQLCLVEGADWYRQCNAVHFSMSHTSTARPRTCAPLARPPPVFCDWTEKQPNSMLYLLHCVCTVYQMMGMKAVSSGVHGWLLSSRGSTSSLTSLAGMGTGGMPPWLLLHSNILSWIPAICSHLETLAWWREMFYLCHMYSNMAPHPPDYTRQLRSKISTK